MPRPSKHVGSFARSHANSETALPRSTASVCLSPPSKRRCNGAITNGGTSLKSCSRACATPRLINFHAIAKLTWSWFCNVARASSTLNRLCRHLSRLAQSDMHAVLRVRCRSKEAYTMTLARDSQTQILNLHRRLCVLKLFKPTAFVATEPVTCLGQSAHNEIPGAFERCGWPNECHVVLKTYPREPMRSQLIRLGDGKLQPEHKHYLHGP